MNFSRRGEVCPARISGFSGSCFTRRFKRNKLRLTSEKPKLKRWKRNTKKVREDSRSLGGRFFLSLGTLRITRRQWQRERHQTKGLMSKTIAMHVHFEPWYISSPSSAKQQREMTKFYVFWRTRTSMVNFSYRLFQLSAVSAYLPYARFYTDRRTEQIYRVATFEGKI